MSSFGRRQGKNEHCQNQLPREGGIRRVLIYYMTATATKIFITRTHVSIYGKPHSSSQAKYSASLQQDRQQSIGLFALRAIAPPGLGMKYCAHVF